MRKLLFIFIILTQVFTTAFAVENNGKDIFCGAEGTSLYKINGSYVIIKSTILNNLGIISSMAGLATSLAAPDEENKKVPQNTQGIIPQNNLRLENIGQRLASQRHIYPNISELLSTAELLSRSNLLGSVFLLFGVLISFRITIFYSSALSGIEKPALIPFAMNKTPIINK